MQLHPEAVSEFRFIQPCKPLPDELEWIGKVKFARDLVVGVRSVVLTYCYA
jgi:hypothetical protein